MNIHVDCGIFKNERRRYSTKLESIRIQIRIPKEKFLGVLECSFQNSRAKFFVDEFLVTSDPI